MFVQCVYDVWVSLSMPLKQRSYHHGILLSKQLRLVECLWTVIYYVAVCVCVCLNSCEKCFFAVKRGANTMNNFVCISCDDIHNTDPFQSFVWHKLCSPLAASNSNHTLWLPNHIVTSWLASMLVWFVLFVLYSSPDDWWPDDTNCDTLQARAICCFPIRWTRSKPICNRAICASYRQPNFYSKLKA